MTALTTGLNTVQGIRKHQAQRQSQQGLTMVELAMVIVIVGVLAAFGMMTWTGVGETGDAGVVQSAQASLQGTITQASARLDIPPTSLNSNNVITAVSGNLAAAATLSASGCSGTYCLTLNQSGRVAAFNVNTAGDVILSSLSGFSQYGISSNGTIQRL